MGHKDIRVTLNTYTSVLNQYKLEELNKVAQYYVDKDFLAFPEETNNIIQLDKTEYIVEDDDIKDIVASTNEEEAYVKNIDCVVEQITPFDIRAYFKELAKLVNKMYPEDNEEE